MRDIAERPLASITHAELEKGILSLVGAQADRRILTARTVRHIASLIATAFKKAFALDLIRANPMLKVELPVSTPREARWLDPEEIHRLRRACRGDWTFSLIEVALATGCRRGELLALEWSDVNWEAHSLIVRKSLEQTRKGLRIKTTKSGKSRVFRLPRAAMDALTAHRALAEFYPHNSKLIFCNRTGEYLKPDLISQIVVRRLRKAGIRDASLHTLRHTHASNLLSRGVPLPAVSVRLGHADPQVTARIYSHALPADDARAADAWDSILISRPD